MASSARPARSPASESRKREELRRRLGLLEISDRKEGWLTAAPTWDSAYWWSGMMEPAAGTPSPPLAPGHSGVSWAARRWEAAVLVREASRASRFFSLICALDSPR